MSGDFGTQAGPIEDNARAAAIEGSGRSHEYPEPVVDEESELQLGIRDVIFGLLTLPLLFWVMMYAVTGHERLYATPRARIRLYLAILAVEVLVALAVVVIGTR